MDGEPGILLAGANGRDNVLRIRQYVGVWGIDDHVDGVCAGAVELGGGGE